MAKSKIYTRTGDKGETALVGGKRLSKADPKIDLYGEVDELNSHIGLGISFLKKEEKDFASTLRCLEIIQHVLFNLGSNLACESYLRDRFKLEQIPDNVISILEKNMDEMDKELPILKNFILPGGSVTASQFHVCRSVTRRVERKLVKQSQVEKLPVYSIEFINRLSDYFFVLGRYVNFEMNEREIIWGSVSYDE